MARLWRPPASVVVFLVIVAGVALWVGSGVLQREPPPAAVAEPPRPLTVAVRWSEAAPVERLLTLYGDVAPNQIVVVRAETAGRVAEAPAARGQVVAVGDPLARLAPGDRTARLQRAQAQLVLAQREYDTAAQLVERGAAPVTRLQTAEAELEAARTEVAMIELEIEQTLVTAPIAGVVNHLLAEVGDFVVVGGEVVQIVDNDPLVAIVQVPQHAIGRVAAGAEARVGILGQDQPLPGVVSSVAPLADARTRTFRVDVSIPNPERALPSGISAEVVIPTDTVPAHLISPAMVSLNDQGQLGVFSVDDAGIVHFHPIRLVRAEAHGVWVSGPPERIRLVTARPGFIAEGQRVIAREAEEAAETASEG